jgi:hypothetical protein
MDDYRSFAEFYPHYLEEHGRRGTRTLHFIGTLLVLVTLVYAIVTRHWLFLLLVPLFGYGFAWLGHFGVEHNRPATFRHPLYSLAGDFRMFADMLTGRIRF